MIKTFFIQRLVQISEFKLVVFLNSETQIPLVLIKTFCITLSKQKTVVTKPAVGDQIPMKEIGVLHRFRSKRAPLHESNATTPT